MNSKIIISVTDEDGDVWQAVQQYANFDLEKLKQAIDLVESFNKFKGIIIEELGYIPEIHMEFVAEEE